MRHRTLTALLTTAVVLCSATACVNGEQQQIDEAEAAVSELLEHVASGDYEAALELFEEPVVSADDGPPLLASADERISDIVVGAETGVETIVVESSSSMTRVTAEWSLVDTVHRFEFVVSGSDESLRIESAPDTSFMTQVDLTSLGFPVSVAGVELDRDIFPRYVFPGVYSIDDAGPYVAVRGESFVTNAWLPDRTLVEGGSLVAVPGFTASLSVIGDIDALTDLAEDNEALVLDVASEFFDPCASGEWQGCDYMYGPHDPVEDAVVTNWRPGEPQVVGGPNFTVQEVEFGTIAFGCWVAQASGPATVTTATGATEVTVYLELAIDVHVRDDNELVVAPGCLV